MLDPRFTHQHQHQQHHHQGLAQSPSSNSIFNRMQQWPSRLFGSTQNRNGSTTPTTSKKIHQHLDGSLDYSTSPRLQSHHQHQLSEFVNQLVESQTNTPRLELKRNQQTKLLLQQQQPQHLVDLQKSRFKCESFSSLAGSALLDRVAATRQQQEHQHILKRSTTTTTTTNQSYPIGRKKEGSSNVDSDNLSIVSSCISFLDEHLKENITNSNNISSNNNNSQQNKLVNEMDSTNEYSEPFDYFTSLPAHQNGYEYFFN